MTTTSISVERLGEALFRLSNRLRVSRFVEDQDNHLAYEAVVAAFQALTRSIPTDDAAVERVWSALKDRVCADPEKAKRCVMVGRDDIAAALTASIPDAAPEGDERGVRYYLQKIATGSSDQFAVTAAKAAIAALTTTAPECPACGGSGRMGPFFPGGLSTVCGNCSTTAQGEVVQADREWLTALFQKYAMSVCKGDSSFTGNDLIEAILPRLAFSSPSGEVERLRGDNARLTAFVRRVTRSRKDSVPGISDAQRGAATIREWRRDAANLLDTLSTPETVSLKGDRA